MKDTPAERLKEVRLERYKTAAEAAKALGIPYPTYSTHENGRRGFKADRAAYYARHFKVRMHWLLTGEGRMRGQKEESDFQRLIDEIRPELHPEILRYLEYMKGR